MPTAQAELKELQKRITDDLLPFAIGMLPEDGEELTGKVTFSITEAMQQISIEVSNGPEKKGLTESNIKAINLAATNTSKAIVSAMDDLQSDSYLRKAAGVLNIAAAASSFATVITPPVGLIVAAVTGSVCILTAGILKQVEKNQREDDSLNATIERAVEEIKVAIDAAFFKENIAQYKATLHIMQTNLRDIERYYSRDLKKMTKRDYDSLSSLDYLNDGEAQLEKLFSYIEDESTDAKQRAALIHAYVMISFIRRQQLVKMQFVFARGNRNYELENASDRLERRYKKDQQRFQWLQNPPNDKENCALYAEVVLLPYGKRSLIEYYVGKIPGQLCLLCNPWGDPLRKDFPTRWRLEMRPGKGNADAKMYPGIGPMTHGKQIFIIYPSSYDSKKKLFAMSIFSVGGAGYLRPDKNDKYVVAGAGKRHDWKTSVQTGPFGSYFTLCGNELEKHHDNSFIRDKNIRFGGDGLDYPCKLIDSSHANDPKRKIIQIAPIKLSCDDLAGQFQKDFWKSRMK